MGAPAILASPGDIDSSQRPVGAASPTRSKSDCARPSSLGNVCATRSNAGTDGSEAFAVGAISAGDDRPRSRPAVLRGPSAARPRRSPPLIRALHIRGRGWHHHGRERGPAALADRAEARGSEKERAAQQARGLRDLRRRLILSSPTGAPAYAESSNTTTKQSPSRPEKP